MEYNFANFGFWFGYVATSAKLNVKMFSPNKSNIYIYIDIWGGIFKEENNILIYGFLIQVLLIPLKHEGRESNIG